MNFDDISTDTVRTSEHSIDQLADMVNDGQTITCSTLEIETSNGTLQVAPVATDLEIKQVDDDE